MLIGKMGAVVRGRLGLGDDDRIRAERRGGRWCLRGKEKERKGPGFFCERTEGVMSVVCQDWIRFEQERGNKMIK